MTDPRRETWSTIGEALRLFLRGATFRTAIRVSAVVGTVLSIVNQGDRVVNGTATADTWARIAANYVIPFLVSSYGFLAARRVPSRG